MKTIDCRVDTKDFTSVSLNDYPNENGQTIDLAEQSATLECESLCSKISKLAYFKNISVPFNSDI